MEATESASASAKPVIKEKPPSNADLAKLLSSGILKPQEAIDRYGLSQTKVYRLKKAGEEKKPVAEHGGLLAIDNEQIGCLLGEMEVANNKTDTEAEKNPDTKIPSFKDLSAPNSRSAQSVFLFPFTDAQCKDVLSNSSRALIKSFPDFLEIKRKSFKSERLAPNLARACNGI